MDSLEANKVSPDNLSENNEATEPKVETTVTDQTTVMESTPVVESSNLEQEEESTSVLTLAQQLLALTKAQLVEKLKTVVDDFENKDQKTDIDAIKQAFYKKLRAEKEAFLQKAEDVKDSVNENIAKAAEIVEDTYETELKSLLATYREKRAEITAQLEAEKLRNQHQKEEIIEKIKAFTENADTIHEHMPEFRQLQQEWKEIGQVPATISNHLYKTYNLYVEKFYDLLKMNHELRDYDFKKNLEKKTSLLENAKNLANEVEDNVVGAFRKLQQLHDEWSQIGPVAKEQREELWAKFKEASSVINKKHADYFEEIKQKEAGNLELKERLCKLIEEIDYSTLKTFKNWEDKTQEVIGWQQEWKTIGFAARKANTAVYERFRTACDEFFAKKNEFFKEIKSEFDKNLEKKKSLVARVENLKDSTEWKEATQKIIEAQHEWKEIGAVSRKYSDAIWKQFIAACDYFFEQKDKAFAGIRAEEKENLAKKIAIIEKIENFEASANQGESVAQLKALIAGYNEIGFVPFKDKEKTYKRFRAACDKQFDALHVDAANRRLNNFSANIESLATKDKNQLFKEREKLLRVYDRLGNEIQTSENNILFFTKGNSKKENPMVVEMQRSIDKQKAERDLILKKIQLIEKQLS
jgi:hypothetical protein